MIDKLISFGLTEKEAKIYHASLEFGKATADQLAKHAGIIRSTSYTQIDALMRYGLMSTYDEGKKTYYVAESPENLTRILARKRDEIKEKELELNKALPSLSGLFSNSGECPKVRMFKGREGFIAIREEILKTKSKQILAALNYDRLRAVFPDEAERNAYSERRQKKGVQLKAIFSTNCELSADQFAPEVYKIVTEAEMPFEFDIYIFDDKVALVNTKGSIWGVVLQGEIIAKSFCTLHEIAWSNAK